MYVCMYVFMGNYPDMFWSPKSPVVVTESPAVNRNVGVKTILRHRDLLLKVPSCVVLSTKQIWHTDGDIHRVRCWWDGRHGRPLPVSRPTT